MENEKNNALEKVEQTIENNGNGTLTRKRGIKTNTSAKKSKLSKKRKKENVKKLSRTEKRKQREKVRAEKEKIRAEKRVELARIKAHKRAEKEKAKATAIREKNRKSAERKALKEQIKAEKQRRRDTLKNETKKQRQKRLAEERAVKVEQTKRRREEKARLKQEKLLAKNQIKEERIKNRQRNKERNKGFGGWLAAVISLGVSTLILASILTFVFLMPTATDTMLESTYQKSFYDTVEQVNNMDINLSKSLATLDTGALQKYLVDVAINSELAENDVQQLPLQDESKYYTTKVINQIGDYAKYLNKKLIDGERLSSEDYANLQRLYIANLAIRDAFTTMLSKMGNDFSFSEVLNGGNGNVIVENFNQLQNLSVGYPELIYDGPFSDAKDRKEIKGLSGDTISNKKAKDIFTELFAHYGVTDISNQGMSDNMIKCYNVQGKIDDEYIYAQISEIGGKLIMFDYAGSCKGVNVDGDYATEKARDYIASLGISDMRSVWINLSNNVYTVNFAYSTDKVIIYPDLIKVRVCAETGMVIGFEATSYYANHTERVIPDTTISASTARKNVSADMEISSSRLAVIPIGQSTEKLCYEFSGEYQGSTYFVYIDATTGKQVEMFKVINSSEGELLM